MERTLLKIENFVYCKTISQNPYTQVEKNNESYNYQRIENTETNNFYEIEYAFESLRITIRQLIFENTNENTLKTQIQKLQKYIIELLYHSKEIAEILLTPIQDDNPIRKETLKHLDNLLFYLENFQPDYIDKNLPCSSRTHEKMVKSIIKNTHKIEDLIQFQSYKYDYKNVLKKLCDTSANLVKNKLSSYSSLHSSSILLSVIAELVVKSNNDFKAIKKYLLSIDYADKLFVKSIKEEIKGSCLNPDSIEDSIENLQNHLRYFKQLRIHPNEYLYLNETTTRSYIIKYLKEEISFNELYLIRESKTDEIIGIGKKEKLKSDLTVEQMSFIANVMVKSNIMDEVSSSQIHNFIANNFYTKRQKEISVKSIKTKHYEANEQTAEVVEKRLQTMLEEINLKKD